MATPGDDYLMMQAPAVRRLFQAIEAHDQETVLINLAAGVSVDVVDNSAKEAGLTPLQLAAVVGNVTAVPTLLEHGADPAFVNRHGETALYLAALNGHDAIIKILSSLVNEKDRVEDLEAAAEDREDFERSQTAEYRRKDAFFAAVCQQDIAESRRLLPTLEINNGEDFGLPLLMVLEHGLTKLVPIVLEAGANPNLWIDKAHGPSTPLGMATATLRGWGNRRRLVKLLLRHGADVNGRGLNGATPLHEAARFAPREWGLLNGLKALLKAGADIEARDDFGNTPWMLAAYEAGLSSPPTRRRKAVIAVLERAGADTSERASVELLLAARKADEQRALDALAGGANPQARTATGASALFLAVDMDAVELVRILLAAGVDPSIPDEPNNPRIRGGITPLRWAQEREHTEIVEMLRSASPAP